MDCNKLITELGFTPKEHTTGIFTKKYPQFDGYYIDVNFDNQSIDYNAIVSDSRTTQNFSQPENFVILECVDRLLTKGYKPQNIVLEKTWSAGHGTSGRLDICVTRDDGTEYLLIECKTYGKEFDKELARMNKDGGQLFTYFQLSGHKAGVIMLYASELQGEGIVYKNDIIKIEEDYRAGDVKDIYDKWNKLTKDNGVFESWVKPYSFESKALTINELKDIKPQDSSFIFNRFLEILRHNVVSDKPNAFNKIFTLFLCKIYDEKINEETDNELWFQWREGVDDDISFQLRLTDLYKDGMWEFLEKRVTDFSEDEFEQKYKNLEATLKVDILRDFKKLRLEKNNEFAIKEVYDEKSFKENAKVVKQVVELLQKYKIRYAEKQQYLSDFFEMLLTTGLKQESGQFFTPVPIAQFIIKSLPIDSIVETKLKEGKRDELLPYIIDYAAGSGHFITESMHEIQRLLDKKDLNLFRGENKKFIDRAQRFHFDWALQYVYGIEKDYRLVKVGKVGCYLHGDGLANVIHSDGLANFEHSDYKGKLREIDKDFKQDNKQFDVVVSNPPYSVSAFKNAAREYYKDGDFELYGRLTDNSSEIECLFIERTKQLLKDGGVAGVILPSSILSNTGIYTKAREVILQYFDIVAITELGSNTFMATGTNTVVLFLRRRNNYEGVNLRKSVESFFTSLSEVTLNGIERPVTKYVGYVWAELSMSDYITLLKKSPNAAVERSELYKEYRKKIKAKNDKEFWSLVLETEREKLYYFILTYPQRVVIVRSGEKDAEKRFLGYEFSNRRGSEGIHPIERGKTIEECTQLFDADQFENIDKASTYIYRAFNRDFDSEISESIQKNVSRTCLVDMLNFDRVDFEKTISTNVEKKVRIESQWEQIRVENSLAEIIGGTPKIEEFNIAKSGKYPVITQELGIEIAGYTDSPNPITDLPIVLFGDHSCAVKYINYPFFRGAEGTVLLKPKSIFEPQYYYYVLNYIISNLIDNTKYERHNKYLKNLYIPLPPKEVQEKIIYEIEDIENAAATCVGKIIDIKNKIESICLDAYKHYPAKHLNQIAITNPSKSEISSIGNGTSVSFIDMASVSNDGYIATQTDRNLGSLKKGSYTYFKENDIIIAKITPCMENGKCGLAKNLTNGIAMGSSEFHVIRVGDEVVSKFIFSFLNRKVVRNEAEKNMTGASGHRRVPISFYEQLSVPVPSIEEQQKIVTEIEALEGEITKAQQIIDNAPAQKIAILKKYL